MEEQWRVSEGKVRTGRGRRKKRKRRDEINYNRFKRLWKLRGSNMLLSVKAKLVMEGNGIIQPNLEKLRSEGANGIS